MATRSPFLQPSVDRSERILWQGPHDHFYAAHEICVELGAKGGSVEGRTNDKIIFSTEAVSNEMRREIAQKVLEQVQAGADCAIA